jgi:phage terminase small subunit
VEKARDAAVAAGYGESGAHVAANRCLVNPKVGAEIQRLSRSLIHTALPTLIRELIELATDKASHRATGLRR